MKKKTIFSDLATDQRRIHDSPASGKWNRRLRARSLRQGPKPPKINEFARAFRPTEWFHRLLNPALLILDSAFSWYEIHRLNDIYASIQ